MIDNLLLPLALGDFMLYLFSSIAVEAVVLFAEFLRIKEADDKPFVFVTTNFY